MSSIWKPSQRPDELYHYGRLGMKWGQHIFGAAKGAASIAGTLTEMARETRNPTKPGAVSGSMFATLNTYNSPHYPLRRKTPLKHRIENMILDGQEFLQKHSSTSYSYVDSISKFADINRPRQKYTSGKKAGFTPTTNPAKNYSQFVNEFYSKAVQINKVINDEARRDYGSYFRPKTTYSRYAKSPRDYSKDWYTARAEKARKEFADSLRRAFGTNIRDL